MVSVLGLSAGALVHVAAATVGLSAILLASATAFNFVKWLGAAYLIYLGVRALTTRRSDAQVSISDQHSLKRLFTDGVVVSILNPKIAVFFLAFLPQFVQPSAGSSSLQVLMLGLLYVTLALFTDSAYALLASRLRGWLGSRVIQGAAPQYASGVAYLLLGVSTAFADRK